ncbi:MAG: FkbM family methyltransferase [Bacteroidetes bacterium]|nr:FkbM family methyltransferase [Bacteroidota bacterium]
MASSFSIALGNFLYKNCFPVYKAVYSRFKRRQDAFEMSLLQRFIKPGDTVLDIGANIGFYTEFISGLVGPTGSVHAFEPEPGNFGHLRKRVSGLINAHIHNKAVSDKTGIIKVYTSKQLNVDHRTYKPDEYDSEIDIPAIAIDDYLAGKPVQFIKMDIQGFELSAAKGMVHTLASPGLVMLSEFWPYGMRKAGNSVLEYFTLLKQAGFFVYLIKDNALQELKEETVKTFLDLPESAYMNIIASKARV